VGGVRKEKQWGRCGKMRGDAVAAEAIDAYAKGFRKEPSRYYLGINAVRLLHLLAT
jgi:hypothetical protein